MHFLFQRCLSNIEAQNLICISEFHLMGFSEDPELQPVLFGLFLSMYLVTVLGNLLIILAVSSDSLLHTPMYFFLSSLSLADICFISTMVPKMILDIHTYSRKISFVACLAQMSLYIIFGCMDALLLTAMAYDRYVAICHPLRYQVIMNTHLCYFLVLVSFLFGILDSQLHNFIILQFPYFKDVQITNFFCDPSQLLSLVCSDTLINNIIMYFAVAISGFFPISGIFLSYYKIFSSILRVPTQGGKYKAFSTCGSHMTVVCLFFGTGIGVYLFSDMSSYPRQSAMTSLMYTVVTPMLNPFIYSLRNRDIKNTFKRLHSKTVLISMPVESILNTDYRR